MRYATWAIPSRRIVHNFAKLRNPNLSECEKIIPFLFWSAQGDRPGADRIGDADNDGDEFSVFSILEEGSGACIETVQRGRAVAALCEREEEPGPLVGALVCVWGLGGSCAVRRPKRRHV